MRDPLRGLTEAWRGLEPPSVDRLEHEPDARTRATVDWMRAAWRELGAPPVPAPRIVPQRPHPLAPILGAVAAAAAAVALLVLVPTGPAPTVEPVATAPPPIRPSFRADGTVELRSGSVRLILAGDGGVAMADKR